MLSPQSYTAKLDLYTPHAILPDVKPFSGLIYKKQLRCSVHLGPFPVVICSTTDSCEPGESYKCVCEKSLVVHFLLTYLTLNRNITKVILPWVMGFHLP